MGNPVVYSDLERRILKSIQKYLIDYFSKAEDSITGGIHMKPKPKGIRLDLIELNTCGISGSRICTKTSGVVNINYQDDNYDRVCEITVLVNNLLTDSVINQFHLKPGYQDWDYQIFPISKYLWLGNNLFYLTHKNK